MITTPPPAATKNTYPDDARPNRPIFIIDRLCMQRSTTDECRPPQDQSKKHDCHVTSERRTAEKSQANSQ